MSITDYDLVFKALASPVRRASCSVPTTIKRAMGTMANAAEKNRKGAGRLSKRSRTSVMGMKASNRVTRFMATAGGSESVYERGFDDAR